MMFNYSWEFSLLIPCLEDLVKQQSMENLLECNIGFDLNLGRVCTTPIGNLIIQIMTTSIPMDRSSWIIRIIIPCFFYHILDSILKQCCGWD